MYSELSLGSAKITHQKSFKHRMETMWLCTAVTLSVADLTNQSQNSFTMSSSWPHSPSESSRSHYWVIANSGFCIVREIPLRCPQPTLATATVMLHNKNTPKQKPMYPFSPSLDSQSLALAQLGLASHQRLGSDLLNVCPFWSPAKNS